jgi:hypothetical protein
MMGIAFQDKRCSGRVPRAAATVSDEVSRSARSRCAVTTGQAKYALYAETLRALSD